MACKAVSIHCVTGPSAVPYRCRVPGARAGGRGAGRGEAAPPPPRTASVARQRGGGAEGCLVPGSPRATPAPAPRVGARPGPGPARAALTVLRRAGRREEAGRGQQQGQRDGQRRGARHVGGGRRREAKRSKAAPAPSFCLRPPTAAQRPLSRQRRQRSRDRPLPRHVTRERGRVTSRAAPPAKPFFLTPPAQYPRVCSDHCQPRASRAPPSWLVQTPSTQKQYPPTCMCHTPLHPEATSPHLRAKIIPEGQRVPPNSEKPGDPRAC